jgi:hypothetical protein
MPLHPPADNSAHQAELDALLAAGGGALSQGLLRAIAGDLLSLPHAWMMYPSAGQVHVTRRPTARPMAPGYHGPARGPQ